jgi:hypothetical protein
MREASSTLTRRDAGVAEKVWMESGLYPSYYLNSWHYQTDGWLSEESAKVYEASTETVFIGKSSILELMNSVRESFKLSPRVLELSLTFPNKGLFTVRFAARVD